MPVTFPTTPLACKVYIALGADLTKPSSSWTWTDITQWVRFADGITTNQGRPDESSTVRVSTASLRLDNRDGRFSRRNPSSPYYGRLTYNTPIWATVDAGAGVVTRLQMFVNEWPTRWDRSGKDSTVPITCAGILRRLAQGADPKSALRGTITGVGATRPTAWWPLEDGSQAIAGSSGLQGGAFTNPIVGPAKFGATPIGDCGAASGVNFFDGGSLTAQTGQVVVASPNGWEFECTVAFSALPPVTGGALRGLVHARSTDAAAVMGIGTVYVGGVFYWAQYIFDAMGTGSYAQLTGLGVIQIGKTYHVRGVGSQEGPGIRLTGYVDGASYFSSGFNGTLMMPDQLHLNVSHDPATPAQVAYPAVVSHLSFRAPYLSSSLTLQAATGYAGEMAHTRIARLCAEEGVPLATTATKSAPLGAQAVGTFMGGVREAEAVDQGVVYETAWGLGYQALSQRYNATVGLALDFQQRHIAVEPEPADDDQRLRNRLRVSRANGSDVTVEQVTGPLGTAAGGPGIYDDSVTLAVQNDGDLIHQGGWRRHLGTIDEDRWPNIALRFHGTPDLITAWTGLSYGARMTAAHPPAQVNRSTIDAIIEGYTEHWDPLTWEAVLSTSPYRPYEVFQVQNGTGNRSRLPAEVSYLDAGVSNNATTLYVFSPVVGWIDSAAYAALFPFDIVIGGERMRVTAITKGGVTDTFTRTVSSSWGTADSGQAWTSTDPVFSVSAGQGRSTHAASGVAINTLAGTSGIADVTGTVKIQIGQKLTGGSGGMFPSLLLRQVDANNYYQAGLYYQPSATGSGNVGLVIAKTVAGAGTNLFANFSFDVYDGSEVFIVKAECFGTTIRIKAWRSNVAEPAAWTATVTDSAFSAGSIGVLSSKDATITNPSPFVVWDDLVITNPQKFTVTRSVEGVVKSQAIGASVQLFNAPVIAL